MNEELLSRLVDALEGINNNLSEIAVSLDSLDKNIDGCISVSQNGKSHYLCKTPHRYANTNRAGNPKTTQIRVCG